MAAQFHSWQQQARVPASYQRHTSSQGSSSDYGGAFTLEEEDALDVLLTQYNSQHLDSQQVLATSFDGLAAPVSGTGVPAGFHSTPRSFASVDTLEELVQSGAFPAEIELAVAKEPIASQTATSADDGPANTNLGASRNNGTSLGRQRAPSTGPADDAKPDTASPLQRFRARKPLSVTDLVSPAWCELQYSFSLHRHGRKRRTVAMRQGSVAHQRLEDEVHTTFKVDVMSKEDAWGLRLWNVIQGARTLRDTGMTRELEVWGVVDGQLVNGIIDELSYECPDYDLELDGLRSESERDGRREGGQRAIEQFFQSQKEGSGLGDERFMDAADADGLKVYLKDHKTRTVRSIPKANAFRPTAMQLMIYHRLLSNLLSDTAAPDSSLLWKRYNVNADVPFSAYFIDQFGDEDEVAKSNSLPSTINTPASTTQPSQSQSSTSFHTELTEPSPITSSLTDLHTLLRTHPTPRTLWSRMLAELRRAMPAGLGNVLRVEYWDQSGGDRIGSKDFLYDGTTLNAYVGQTMKWWDGQREPRGVEVEEAWKCGSCEFADSCGWRKEKVDEGVRRMRERKGVMRDGKGD